MVKLFCSHYWQKPHITAAARNFQKQSLEVFCKNMCSLKISKYHKKISMYCSQFSIKLQALGPANLLQWNSNTNVAKFGKFLRTAILKNNCKQLLLYFHYNSHHHFHYYYFHYHQKQTFADVLHNIAVPKNFANLIGKHWSWSIFLINLQTWGLQL